MYSSHLGSPINSNPHHHNSHQPHITTTTTFTTKMPSQNNNATHNYNTNEQHKYAGLTGSNALSKSCVTNTNANNTPTTIKHYTNNVGAGLPPASTAPSTLSTNTTTSYKFAPARRLAARQTLRLAIPKQQGDSQHSQFNSTAPPITGHSIATQFRHASPSQLPPAPILKRTPANTPNFTSIPSTSSFSSHIPKSASPLESQNLPNVLHHSNTPICTASPATAGSSNRYLRVRNPSITLSTSDVCNNNDLFAFAKEFSTPAVAGGDHSPIFADIAASMSPSTASSGSPTNHLSRLFNLSPSTLRNYGNSEMVRIEYHIKF